MNQCKSIPFYQSNTHSLNTHTSVYKPQLDSISTLCVCRTCSLSMSDTMPCSRVSSVWCCGSWSRKLFLRLLSASLSSCTSSACCQNKNRTGFHTSLTAGFLHQAACNQTCDFLDLKWHRLIIFVKF